MKYIRGIWRIPETLKLVFDEDLIANPTTKTIFEEALTAGWGPNWSLDEDYRETRTLRLVVSSEDVEANNLYLLGRADDGTEQEYWRYHSYYYDDTTIVDNSITLDCMTGNDGSTTIMFGLEPQEVSDEFYDWWTTNTIEVPQMSVDLSKYNLSGDTHTVVIKTLDANGNVIDISNEVIWEKANIVVVPDDCFLEYTDNGDWVWVNPGESFPQPIPEDARISHSSGEGNGDVTYTYHIDTNSWSCSYSSHPFTVTDVQILDNLGGAPVTTLEDGAFLTEGWGGMYVERLYVPTSITYIGEGIVDGTSGFTEIIYAGTMAEWNNITFHENWNAGGPAFIVTCTDGTIDVPAGENFGGGSGGFGNGSE